MAGGATRWSHADGLGSVQLVTDGAGAAAGGGGYEPWGAAQPGTTGLGAFAYAGEQGDGESGLVYLRARHYDPATGRFLQPDPAGMAASGPNLYGYAGGNPTSFVNPSGRIAWEAAVPWVAAVVFGPEVAAALLPVAVAVAVVGTAIGVGYAVGQLAGPRAYSGDAGGLLGTPYYSGDTGALLGSPGGGAVAPLLTTLGPAPSLGDAATHPGGMAAYTGDTGSLLASSYHLGKNLGAAGFAGAEAHHIVAENSKRAAGARRILARVGIGVDESENGVWLQGPRGAPVPGFPSAHVHRPIHTKTYYSEVEQRLRIAAPLGKPGVIAELDQIRQEILVGTFPK